MWRQGIGSWSRSAASGRNSRRVLSYERSNTTLFLFLIFGLATADHPQTAKTNAALIKEAREAHAKEDKATFLALYEELARRRPGEIYILYNLAGGQALNGQTEAALGTLIATSRSSRLSRARYTSPIPPAPRGERIS